MRPGLAVLLLLIVKHGPATVDAADSALVAERIQEAKADIAVVREQRDGLRSRRRAQEQALAANLASLQAASDQQTSQALGYTTLLSQLQAERAALRAAVAKLRESQVAAREPDRPPETHAPKRQLTGINVQDDRVAIFLDRSASMLHRSLVEIIRLRASGPAAQRQAEKWADAKEAVLWAYRQLPHEGRFQLFTYAQDLRDLDGAIVEPGDALDWRIKDARSANAGAVDAAVAPMLPGGPTNLRQVFEAAARLDPRPEQLLILTDGLPTLPGDRRLGSLHGCRESSRRTRPVLSPACRASIYLDAVRVVERRLAGVSIDVVLYPLDGDADAVRGYWLLTALSGGRLLTPAEGWP